MSNKKDKQPQDGYTKLAEMILMSKVIKYKELRSKEQTEEVKAEIKELDEYFRSDEFRALSGFDEKTVETIIDGLKNGGKYYRSRPGKKLYHGHNVPF